MGNEHRRRCVNGDEQDVHTRWRHVVVALGKARVAGKTKRRTNKRERRGERAMLRRGEP